MLQSIQFYPHPSNSFLIFSQQPLLKPSLFPSLTFLYKRTNTHQCPAVFAVAQSPETPISAVPNNPSPPEDGPIEISPDVPSIFATNDDPTPIQVATSVLLTGAITVFLFRSVRRRVKRAKELRMRSSGATKTLKDEAMDNLKAMGSIAVEPKGQPSPVQALLGGFAAGVIALILYKFTTTIEASLNRQTLSDSYSVRQITVTVRTIINGLCYLATFVFGINSVGLFLYSGQLALNSIFDGSTGDSENSSKETNPVSPNTSSSGSSNTSESSDSDQTS